MMILLDHLLGKPCSKERVSDHVQAPPAPPGRIMRARAKGEGVPQGVAHTHPAAGSKHPGRQT